MRGGVEAVQATIKRVRQKDHLRQAAAEPLPGQPRQIANGATVRPGAWAPHADGDSGLPPEFPVHVLGMDGDDICVVDALGQLRRVGDSQFGQGKIQSLFGDRQNYLYWAFPRFGRDPENVTGWRAELVREVMYNAAAKRGLFSAVDRVRGRGGWKNRHGQFIWHGGDALWTIRSGRLVAERTGEVGEYFYNRRPPTLDPWPDAVTDSHTPAHDLVTGYRSWNWMRPIDPLLFLGWQANAMLGGALDWRACTFVTGDKAVGKSSLQMLNKALFGPALHATADTTAAGIYQRVGQDSLPVAVDELEADARPARVEAVVQLARLASSGAVMFRGGSDHVGTEFQARNAFFFSSINPPPLAPQDRSRMAILRLSRLDPLSSGDAVPVFNMDAIGPMLLRRLMDQWPNHAALYANYRAALRAGGHDGRGQDTYGTLLACAHMALGDEALEALGYPAEDLSQWADLLPAKGLPEREDANENWLECLVHLLTSRVETWRDGGRQTVGALLDEMDRNAANMDYQIGRGLLDQAGLGIIDRGKRCEGFTLAIPNRSQLLHRLYQGSKWAGNIGAAVWPDALRQGPDGIIITRDNQVKVNGVNVRCTLVDLTKFHAYMKENG